MRLNQVEEGVVYLQVSRGAADRSFMYPGKDVEPTLVMFTQDSVALKPKDPAKGIRVVTRDDLRWGRRDIKTVQLLYPSMTKMDAAKAGADDAWLVENGYVTEGTSNNAFIVTRDGTIVTRELSDDIFAWHHPGGGAPLRRRGPDEIRGTVLLPPRRPLRPARHSSPRPQTMSCPSSRSITSKSERASPGLSLFDCAKSTLMRAANAHCSNCLQTACTL